MPPEPHGLVADFDAALVQQVFDVAQATAGTGHTSSTAKRMISGLVLNHLKGLG